MLFQNKQSYSKLFSHFKHFLKTHEEQKYELPTSILLCFILLLLMKRVKCKVKDLSGKKISEIFIEICLSSDYQYSWLRFDPPM